MRVLICVIVQNYSEIGQAVLEISHFFSIFKIAAIRYFEIFGQPLDWEAQCVSPYQISVKRLLRYRTQQFSNWRPSTILDF